MVAAEFNFESTLEKLPLRLYFQDEGRFGRINTVQKCWCKKGVIPKVTQQLVREYTYVFSAVCPETGELCSIGVLTVAINNIGNRDVREIYFDQSFLKPASQKTFSGKIVAGKLVNVDERNYQKEQAVFQGGVEI